MTAHGEGENPLTMNSWYFMTPFPSAVSVSSSRNTSPCYLMSFIQEFFSGKCTILSIVRRKLPLIIENLTAVVHRLSFFEIHIAPDQKSI